MWCDKENAAVAAMRAPWKKNDLRFYKTWPGVKSAVKSLSFAQTMAAYRTLSTAIVSKTIVKIKTTYPTICILQHNCPVYASIQAVNLNAVHLARSANLNFASNVVQLCQLLFELTRGDVVSLNQLPLCATF